MKTKIMTGVLAGVISNAAFAAPDVAAIKAACQSSDKTIWVEKNQICIPANPCTSDNMNAKQYCASLFMDDQTGADEEAMGVVDLYAKIHGLDCEPVKVEFNAVGQDYVTCVGNDVMVFEFDDTRNNGSCDLEQEALIKCVALGGEFFPEYHTTKDYVGREMTLSTMSCRGVSGSMCAEVGTIIDGQYTSSLYGMYDDQNNECILRRW